MAKIEILTPSEQITFDSPPHLSADEQIKYFHLPAELQSWLKTVSTPTNQVGFILLWGYCQTNSKFFQPAQFLQRDIRAVCKQQNIAYEQIQFSSYAQRTFNNHKQVIRQHLRLQPFNDGAQTFFLQSIQDKVARHQLPKQILQDVKEALKTKRIEIPGYNRFALVITQAVNDFEKNLVKLVEQKLSPTQRTEFDALLETKESTISAIAKLKTISHSRKPRAIKESIQIFQTIQRLYQELLPIISTLNLHADTVKYYANWIRKANLYRIIQLHPNKRYLYMIGFVIHQNQLRQDILADILLASVQATENATTRAQKDHAYKQAGLQKQTLQLLSAARVSYKTLLKQIEKIAASCELSAAEQIKQIKQLLCDYHQQMTEPKLDELAQNSLNELATQDYYNLLEGLSVKLQNRVADIMRHLSFDKMENQETSPSILLAIQHYQSKAGGIGKEAPIEFLTEKERASLFMEDGKFRVSLYKALLYLHTSDSLKSGLISLAPAYRYLSLEKYLHPKEHWRANKVRLLEETGLTQFADIELLLQMLSKKLHGAYHKTNRRIKDGKNPHITFATKGQMVLATPKVEKINTQPVSALFSECKYVSILQILSDVQRFTGYLDCLRHYSVKDQKILPKPSVFYAAILSLGCNIGVSKMANVSKGVSEDSLLNLVNWHMSLENIHAANQCILDLLGRLSLAKIYQKTPDKLHTSSDGRKVGVAVESLNANASFKYFGSGIGTTLYTFIDELNRLFYSTAFSSSEREAAYVADGLMHNLSIKSSIHSTDTHGYSEAIFGILHLLDISFAPRIKTLKKATLYGFEPRKIYEAKGYKILPHRYIDNELIKAHWDDILRVMVTLKLKETTASQLFKRFSAYSKQHPLYCAIKEFGRIIKSLFILRYIDEVELRQAIEKQLNRIELSNKFSKAILFGNNQEIQYSGKEEQEMVVGCQRLIQNAIVLWNELYLSQKLATTEDEEKRQEILKIIRNGSTLVWQHANFHGEYDFTQDIEELALFDMKKIMALVIS